MKPCIIGEMRSGKDTVAAILSLLFPQEPFMNLKFGDPLLDAEKAVFDSFGLPIPEDKTMRRKFLQYLGTEFLENLNQNDLLARIFEKKYSVAINNSNCNFIITDARRENQVEVARKLGFKIVKIYRLERDRITAGATCTNHKSEDLARNYPEDKLDYKIFNYGTLDDLKVQVIQMVHDLFPVEVQ